MADADPRDEELVRRYLEGDGDAFASLVKRHERRVYNLSLRMTGSEEDARDATQDAFLRGWREIPRLRDPDRYDTWQLRLLVHACYDVLRGRKRRVLVAIVPQGATS